MRRLTVASSSLAFAGVLICAGPLMAQRSPTVSEGRDGGFLEEVIVTGTRLPLALSDTFAPVTVLSRADIENGGANSIGDVLQALPMNVGSPLNTNVNVGGAEGGTEGSTGDGSIRVALRGFNTLVLLNGRRLPSSGVGFDPSIDLNTLPVSAIERVEVLASGASAVYGSDAIGGVINIVTRQAGEDLELSASHTVSAHGDGEVLAIQAAAGVGWLDSTWTVGVDYVNQDGVTLDRRDYSAVPLLIMDGDGTLGYAGNNATPEGRFLVPDGNTLGLPSGPYTRVAGATGQTAADYRAYDRNVDGFNYTPFNYSQTPNRRTSLWLLGSLPFGERANLFVEGLVHHRESAQQAAPAPYYVGSLPAPTLADGSPGIPVDNYYNPFGVDLRAAPASLPVVARRFVELGGLLVDEEVDLWRALVGLELAVSRWTWTLSLATARSEATTEEKGILLPSRLASALGPSGPNDAGLIVCGRPDPATGRVPVASTLPGCVPVNLFGGPGTITLDQLDYVSASFVHAGSHEQQAAEWVMSGPWGRILDEDIQWVLGADYRREAGKLVFDPVRALEFEEVREIRGDYGAGELFGVVQALLLRDRPWSREVAVSLGVRWSDFSAFDHHTTWQAGLRWQPAADLNFRANYAGVFHAPGLGDLHHPRIRVSTFELDPCGNDPTARQRAHCAANGVPGGAYVQGEEAFIVIAGGNPELKPETGHTFGAGLIYTPGWVPGLSASIDYFEVELANLIGQRNPDEVLRGCADSGEFCDDIRRHPDGRIEQLSTLNGNFAGLFKSRGVDFAVDWQVTTRSADWNSSVMATYLDSWDEQPFPGDTTFHHAGQFSAGAMPRWRASGILDWQYGSWSAAYAAEYIGSYRQLVEWFPFAPVRFEPYTRRVDAVLYHDIEAGYEFESGVSVRAGITNVSDEDPPYVNRASAGNTDAGTYRLLGRTFFFQLRYRLH
jgi:outer membrane receptor protein involved in Fe transport